MAWQSPSDYKKDGTMVLLLVDYSDDLAEHPLEDEVVARTVGCNNFLNDGDDTWHIAGWCWDHDHFTEGCGEVVGFQPMPALPLIL